MHLDECLYLFTARASYLKGRTLVSTLVHDLNQMKYLLNAVSMRLSGRPPLAKPWIKFVFRATATNVRNAPARPSIYRILHTLHNSAPRSLQPPNNQADSKS